MRETLDKCYGCGACEKVCPNGSIVLKYNTEGFLYPTLQEDSCKGCGLCQKVCPIFESKKKIPNKSYAIQTLDSQYYSKSASSGVFGVIAKSIIAKGGCVAGAVISKELFVEHIFIDDEKGIYDLQGSKYVQSDVRKAYEKCCDLLESEKPILFVGTPCQIVGLKNLISQKGIVSDNLYCIDLVCHGVPSPLFFKNHMEKIERDCEDIRFRNHKWWNSDCFGLSFLKNGKMHYIRSEKDVYVNSFIKGLDFRESCYQCQFALGERTGDITIGDLATRDDYYNKLDCSKSVSLLTVNTHKGELILNQVNKQLRIVEIDYEKEMEFNHQLKNPFNREQIRDEFYKLLFDEDNLYCEEQITDFLRMYYPLSAVEMCRYCFRRITPQWLRKKMKNQIRPRL